MDQRVLAFFTEKKNGLTRCRPIKAGGEMIAECFVRKTTYNEIPFKFEAGTPDFVGTTALASALDYVAAWASTTLPHTKKNCSIMRRSA